MKTYRDIRLEMMRPRQIAECRRKADVALLPLGILEWHSEQNPIGLDALKAHEVCCRAVERIGGGAVLPPLLWGTPRDSFNVGKEGGGQGIADILETEKARWVGMGPFGGMDIQAQWLFYQQLLRMALEQAAGFGFKSIYILSGHGPFIHFVNPVATAFTRASRIAKVLVTTDWGNGYDVAGIQGDHAGKGETSAMLAIDEELVDLNQVPHNPNIEKDSYADASAASAKYGDWWLDTCADAVAKEAVWLVENYPKCPPRHGHTR